MPGRAFEPVYLIVHRRDTEAGVALHGEIDARSESVLRGSLARCLADDRHAIDIDLAGVTHCDATGLRVFHDLAKAAVEGGGHLRLHNPGRNLSGLFVLTGTGTMLHAVPASGEKGPEGCAERFPVWLSGSAAGRALLRCLAAISWPALLR
ncbi:STAS domain-containing protein [Yinghuangia soli]|uniref:STAS domain-containing protein n=1 Tax=Yinghuangia soli TaxID=2908204 RepID=A0AA41PWV3_9ACTN|nr:STAS domain-containing protein [Yinghuangia soli]MCF2527186.1 STAS domain-containing protein [Yinghuangia soli]